MNNYQMRRSDDIEGTESVAKALAHVLSETFTLYLKTLNFHWNVEGARFVGIHTLTDTQYHNMFEAIDVLAERIRALGFYAPGSFKSYQKMSSIEEADDKKISAEEMLTHLEKDHVKMTSTIRESVSIAEEAKDSTTADLLSERRNFHDQAAWMLRSLRK